jgi:hypothetical protein
MHPAGGGELEVGDLGGDGGVVYGEIVRLGVVVTEGGVCEGGLTMGCNGKRERMESLPYSKPCSTRRSTVDSRSW